MKGTEEGAERGKEREIEREREKEKKSRKVSDKESGRSETVREEKRSQGDPINIRVYRAVMPVVAAYLLDTHLNLDRSRPGEPREKPHTSRLPAPACLAPSLCKTHRYEPLFSATHV